MLVVVGTDWTDSCKSNYHTTMTAPAIIQTIQYRMVYNGGVMVGVLASGRVDHGFKLGSGQSKDLSDVLVASRILIG